MRDRSGAGGGAISVLSGLQTPTYVPANRKLFPALRLQEAGLHQVCGQFGPVCYG